MHGGPVRSFGVCSCEVMHGDCRCTALTCILHTAICRCISTYMHVTSKGTCTTHACYKIPRHMHTQQLHVTRWIQGIRTLLAY